MTHFHRLWIPVAIFLAAFLPQPALAYIGPGVGLGAIAVALALIVGFVLLIVGLVWFPLKRKLRQARDAAAEGEQETTPE